MIYSAEAGRIGKHPGFDLLHGEVDLHSVVEGGGNLVQQFRVRCSFVLAVQVAQDVYAITHGRTLAFQSLALPAGWVEMLAHVEGQVAQ
jgi:hypothetical protein